VSRNGEIINVCIDCLGENERCAVDIVCVVDISGSMGENVKSNNNE